MARAVAISGMGISCALGADVASVVAGLRQASPAPRSWTVHTFAEPVEYPLYLLSDSDGAVDDRDPHSVIECAVREAVDAAGLSAAERARLPLFLGTSAFSLDRGSSEAPVVGRAAGLGVQPVLSHHQIEALLCQMFGGVGESFAFQTACTSSANALVNAARMISLGWFDHALVLGVELANLTTLAGFSSLQLLAPALRPFDRHRAGIVIGEGVGAVVLSAADRSAPRFFVRGGANNIDSYRVTASNPDGITVAALGRELFRRTGLTAEQIRGIKAHGTGSPVNDAGEAAAMCRLFDVLPPLCALKPYVGHTLGACGAIELVLMALALEHGFIPATPGFREPDAALGVVPTTAASDAPDGYYLLNFFGFGGHNTMLALEKKS